MGFFMSIAKFIKKDKIIQLQVIRFEGEMMEIIWPYNEEGPLLVGEYISYFCEDKFIDSRVIRSFKDHVHLFIPNFRETLDFVNYNRSFPRYNVNLTGLLSSVNQVVPMNIIDLSQNGFGFITHGVLSLFQKYDALIHHDFLNIHCEVLIHSQSLDINRYGAEITYIQDKALNKLQNYLLSIRLLIKK
jgi:hypothetical protein